MYCYVHSFSYTIFCILVNTLINVSNYVHSLNYTIFCTLVNAFKKSIVKEYMYPSNSIIQYSVF